MKKTILALAVPATLATGAANAAINLYDGNGITVDIGGAAEVQYLENYNSAESGTIRIDDADFYISTEIDITRNLSAIASVAFALEGNTPSADNTFGAAGTVQADEAWVGFNGPFGTLTFGRQFLISDSAGNAKDYELGTEQFTFYGPTASSQAIKYVYDAGMYYFGVSYAENQTSLSAVDSGTDTVDGRIGVRYAGLDARAYFYRTNNGAVDTNFDDTLVAGDILGYNLEVNYDLGYGLDIAASFGQTRVEDSAADATTNTIRKFRTDAWQISVGYQADEKTYFALGFDKLNNITEETVTGTNGKSSSDSVYANVSYLLHPAAKVYAEIGQNNIRLRNSANTTTLDGDFGYLVGMEVKF